MVKTIFKIIALMLLSVLAVESSYAQTITYKNYNERTAQFSSMENGKWWFYPKEYYYVVHNNGYAGAYKTGLNIKFKVTKSKVGQVGPARAEQIPLEKAAVYNLNAQIDSIQPLVIEESVREAERLVDIVYPEYKDEFQELGESISESLLYVIEKSNGRYAKFCKDYQLEYDAICSEIEYIHKQGPTSQIEPTKRQLAFEDARLRMNDLAEKCSNLAYLAYTDERCNHSKTTGEQ